MQMQFSQGATCFAEMPKILGCFYGRNAGQFFAQVVGVAFTVVG
jgi:hypothetical protein